MFIYQDSVDALANKKTNTICVQWFVVIATGYLLLFKDNEIFQDPLHYILLLPALGSIVVIQRLPQSVFDHPLFCQGLTIIDTLFISTAIALNREGSWEVMC